MTVRSEYFDTTIGADFYDLICGKKLGSGIGRQVFVNNLDPTTVIKFETGSRSFQNAMEWETWEAYQYAPVHAKWFAPCLHISPCGTVMIQRRTEPIPVRLLPKEIPHWSSDTKQENWGLLDGRPVMHDYGYSLLLSSGTKRMKKAKFFHNF